ncbi:hypothetical protein ACOME3_002723 [Neoechinorhynchus agilis]
MMSCETLDQAILNCLIRLAEACPYYMVPHVLDLYYWLTFEGKVISSKDVKLTGQRFSRPEIGDEQSLECALLVACTCPDGHLPFDVDLLISPRTASSFSIILHSLHPSKLTSLIVECDLSIELTRSVLCALWRLAEDETKARLMLPHLSISTLVNMGKHSRLLVTYLVARLLNKLKNEFFEQALEYFLVNDPQRPGDWKIEDSKENSRLLHAWCQITNQLVRLMKFHITMPNKVNVHERLSQATREITRMFHRVLDLIETSEHRDIDSLVRTGLSCLSVLLAQSPNLADLCTSIVFRTYEYDILLSFPNDRPPHPDCSFNDCIGTAAVVMGLNTRRPSILLEAFFEQLLTLAMSQAILYLHKNIRRSLKTPWHYNIRLQLKTQFDCLFSKVFTDLKIRESFQRSETKRKQSLGSRCQSLDGHPFLQAMVQMCHHVFYTAK